MKLIEADAVYKILESCEIEKATIGNPLTDWEYGYNCGIERAESEIECAPTVEAIPIEWLKEWAKKEDNFFEGTLYASLISTILTDWQLRKEE